MRGLSVALAAGAVVGLAGVANATPIEFNLDTHFADPTAPAGSGPWISVRFDQDGDDVKLTVTSMLLDSSEFMSRLYLNFERSGFVAEALTIQDVGGVASKDKVKSDAAHGTHANAELRPDGDGYFDIRIDWDKKAFAGGQAPAIQSVFSISLSNETLDLNDFVLLSAPAGGETPGPFYAAAKIQGIGTKGEDSSWIGTTGFTVIPLPSIAGLGLLGLALIGGIRHRPLA